ncbi:MAG: hypothetical protein K0R91_286 [Nitrososphaeraceae archaeon]|nr:hypothetical protein [Nitrososphaeraceae archaeon]
MRIKMTNTVWKRAEAPYIITLVYLFIGGLAIAPPSVYASSDNNDDDDNDDNSHQFSELGDTSPVQEENVQGRTVIGSAETQIAATIVGTDDTDTILGTPTDL